MSRVKFTFTVLLILTVMTTTVALTVWKIVTERQVGPDDTRAPIHIKQICAASMPWRNWSALIIHHTASPSGNVAGIHQGHLNRGWEGIGYHFVIGNGHGMPDGQIEATYRWKKQLIGSHARGHAKAAVGISLVGNFDTDRNGPTPAQLESLAKLSAYLTLRLNLSDKRIKLHSQVGRTVCPGRYFPENAFRKLTKLYTKKYARSADAARSGVRRLGTSPS